MTLSIAFITSEVRATGLKSFMTLVVTFLGLGITDCAAVDGALKQVLEYTPQLLSTVPNGPPTEIVCAWCLIYFGSLEGTEQFSSVDSDVTVIRFE